MYAAGTIDKSTGLHWSEVTLCPRNAACHQSTLGCLGGSQGLAFSAGAHQLLSTRTSPLCYSATKKASTLLLQCLMPGSYPKVGEL